ncbi:uncharacterized protein LOC114533270 isoform X2 [Dendronephthya gigantea]|uniref:uncharacterized protein LOC114533270 isoform X2 n=1 Tax=Dendronephthya gigantea TaxID=151771 RepID=UPI00106B1E36|nr:uncharacterized protein LOC114533270 isoform X2 [Dendronephthya gigantea]
MMFCHFAVMVICGLSFYAEAKIELIKGEDPGSCDQNKHGKEVLIHDRSDNDKILTCVKENKVYLWKSIDGSSTLGEFINPAYDCTDALNADPQAKDGFYWINFKNSNANKSKVWCDMTTDGGGFALIGRKTTPILWTLPSNGSPVHPYGPPHWSSSLGDAPILDFRVQIGLGKSLKSTKAHWSYRLKSKRPLKQLLQQSKDCGFSSAGIADIAYVKDLQTNKIVTHKLSCSKFGYAYSPSTGFGWVSMNKCLERPCPQGYAVDKGSQHDYAGAFSYSVEQSISGLERGATAFIGCDGKKCCGCFGPKGGRKDYCSQSCDKDINGDRVHENNVNTWYWVRSSVPKAVWKKCMDYKVKRRDGKTIWYKIVGSSAVPVEGRCNKDEVNLLDGIAVIPKGKNIPPLRRMVAFREGSDEIYVRSNGNWSALAQKDKIQKDLPAMMNSTLKKFKDGIEINGSKILEKVDLQVRPKLKNLKTRLDAQNTRLSEELKKLENEVKGIKKALGKTTKSTTPSPLNSECASLSLQNPNGYKWLTNRNRNYRYITITPYCDDHLSQGWYRFGGEAGTQIATTCVPKRRCGTHAPGWMTQKHPTVSEGKVTRTVAFHWDGNCRKWSQNIQVINCGVYYVYYLGPSVACKLRYCGS